jgi:hypothetical protein
MQASSNIRNYFLVSHGKIEILSDSVSYLDDVNILINIFKISRKLIEMQFTDISGKFQIS